MSHVRTQIRDRVATTLASVGTVHKSRITPLGESALPVVLVYTNSEQIEVESFNTLLRRLDVVVEYVAQAASALDTTLDDKIALIEAALLADTTLLALVVEIVPATIEIVFDNAGAQPVGRARVTFAAQYRTALTDSTISI